MPTLRGHFLVLAYVEWSTPIPSRKLDHDPSAAWDRSTLLSQNRLHSLSRPDHQGAIRRLGAGEVEHRGGDERGLPLGVIGEEAFLPRRRTIFVVVAILSLAEDQATRGGVDLLGGAS